MAGHLEEETVDLVEDSAVWGVMVSVGLGLWAGRASVAGSEDEAVVVKDWEAAAAAG